MTRRDKDPSHGEYGCLEHSVTLLRYSLLPQSKNSHHYYIVGNGLERVVFYIISRPGSWDNFRVKYQLSQRSLNDFIKRQTKQSETCRNSTSGLHKLQYQLQSFESLVVYSGRNESRQTSMREVLQSKLLYKRYPENILSSHHVTTF